MGKNKGIADDQDERIYFNGKKYGISKSAFQEIARKFANISGEDPIVINEDDDSITISLQSDGSSALAKTLNNHISAEDGLTISWQEEEDTCKISPNFEVI
mgnify:CR=1 FL=1